MPHIVDVSDVAERSIVSHLSAIDAAIFVMQYRNSIQTTPDNTKGFITFSRDLLRRCDTIILKERIESFSK